MFAQASHQILSWGKRIKIHSLTPYFRNSILSSISRPPHWVLP